MAIRPQNNDAQDFNNPESGDGLPGRDERLEFVDDKGNNVVTMLSDADGTISLLINDVAVSTGGGGGGGTYEVPTGAINGVNDTYTFSSAPVLVFRNGVMETRLGTVDGVTFIFDTPPPTDDDVEGLI